MKQIPLTLPWLSEKEAQASLNTLLSGWVTQGPKVREFEDVFASYTGADYACAVSSCTAALHLALLAVGVEPGNVVITVSHSFIATSNAIRYCQAEPVFIDISQKTLNMDPDNLAWALMNDFYGENGDFWYREIDRLVTKDSPLLGREKPLGRLAAILIVHQAGMPADLARILSIAERYSIPVVEDAACAIGSEVSFDRGFSWEKIGRPHGEIACFSFHPRKVITTGDGGMLVTNKAHYDCLFRLLRHHGMSVPDDKRHRAQEVIFEDYSLTGFNYRMTDIQASIGTEQLRRLPEIVARRRTLAALYEKGLKDIEGLHIPHEPAYARTNWQSYIVQLNDPGKQKPLMQALLESGISTRRGIMCAHLEVPYSKPWPVGCLPKSEAARDQGITLPLYPTMDKKDIFKTISIISKNI